jgi:hydroxyacylglutathione hydrolase
VEIMSFRTPGLGDQTYLLAHEGRAVLIDPQRDLDRFLEAAQERDLDLRMVLETHLHNDYVSGGAEAARRTGAELVMPAAAAPAYRSTPAFHLEEIDAGQGLSVRPLHTPGHTPEHTSYVVLVDGQEVAVFSGGSLLVRSAGRPDLLGPERADTLARLQYISIHRLAGLAPDLGLYPTHGEGSFCTASGAGKFTSTIGEEAKENPLLQLSSPEELSEAMLSSPMPIPAFYRYMGPANTFGVKPMPEREVPRLPVDEVMRRTDVHLVDIRPREDQAEGTLPGSVTVELGDDFGSWTGWLVPYDEPVVLVANPDQDVEEAVTQLRQIQFDNVVGVVNELGTTHLTPHFDLVDLEAARRMLDEDVQVLDVRMASELAEVRMPGAVERFVAELFTKGIPEELDREKPVLVVCASGRRASIAASLLVREGFDVRVLDAAGVPDLTAVPVG